jgi:Zn-dependent peptidase ImmA (M78 family)
MDGEEHDDRRVTRRSNDECRRLARETKAHFELGRTWPVKFDRVFRRGKIMTVRGEMPLSYRVVDNSILGLKDATTEVVDGSIVITVKQIIDSQARWGEGRARMTLAHELRHAVMHATAGAVDNRATGATGTTTVSKLNAAESAEHQAKVFASAFLIDDLRAAELSTPLEIAEEFLVSLSAAEICFERIQADRGKAAAADRVQQANRDFQALMRLRELEEKEKNKKEKKNRYLDARCSACTLSTLIQLGTKVACETCGYVGDHPDDG